MSVLLLQVFVCVLVCAAYASAGFLGGGDGGYSGGGGGGWQSGERIYQAFIEKKHTFERSQESNRIRHE